MPGKKRTRKTEPTTTPASDAPPPLDIAIVGMSCLLPGASTIEAFWDNNINARDAIGDIPPDRFDAGRWFDPEIGKRDRIYSKRGGFIDDVPFDPLRFGIPPTSLASIDPIQLLALELVDRALRDAGHDALKEDFPQKPRTCVILGAGGGLGALGSRYNVRAQLPELIDPVDERLMGQLPEWTEDSFAGVLLNVIAGRISNKFDLGGVTFTVDAACASALAAVYLACRELADGTSDMAIAGGVDTAQSPLSYLSFSSAHALTPGDQPRVFDAAADGIVISEGLAAVVLKRLADAERDGNRIYAVIRAIAGGSDGRSKGMTAPREEGQHRTLLRAYAQARVSPATVGLFEAHGTGTSLGDRTECLALNALLNAAGARPAGAAIGSVKSMIGHTKCAAGVAGLIRSALALYYRTLPPTLHVTTPNPDAGLTDGPLYVNGETRPWIRGHDPRRAGVSAFGFGGTNFHAVLEEYTSTGPLPRAVPRRRGVELFAFSAETPAALAAEVRRLASRLRDLPPDWAPALEDAAYTHFSAGLPACRCRAAVLANDLATLLARLDALADASVAPEARKLPDGVYLSLNAVAAPGSVAFLFPGQGAQFPHMLHRLAQDFPVVQDVLAEADAVLAAEMPAGLSHLIFPPTPFSPEEKKRATADLTATDVAQPALGATDAAMLAFLDACGVRPDMVAGHSYGELVALHAGGVYDRPDLFRLSRARGQAMASLAGGNGERDLGTMLAVKADHRTVAATIEGLDGAWLANCNSPTQTVISGTREAIKTAAERFAAQNIGATPIPVACAFHSPIVAPARDAFGKFMSAIPFREPAIPVFSNTSAGPHDRDPAAIRRMLQEQIVSPVRFVEEIEAMHAAGARLFVEVGPNQILTRLVQQTLKGKPHAAIPTNAKDDDSTTPALAALARLFTEGLDVRFDLLYENRPLQHVDYAAPTKGATHPARAQMMLVNGAYVRPAAAPPRDCKTKAMTMHVNPPQQGTGAPLPGGPIDPAIMLRWQQTMQRFLETQQQVMQAYLAGEGIPPDAMLAPPAAAPAPPATAHASAPAASATPSVAEPGALEPMLVGLVAERTGYPKEMLDLNADLESDLGVDSIKRVEILSAFAKQLPQAGPELAERFSGARTLREILDIAAAILGEQQVVTPPGVPPAEVTPVPTANAPLSADGLMQELKALIADRTGYPTDMLDPALDMEADLGIDSIKRVEILTAFGKKLPNAGSDLAEKLALARTMQDVVNVAITQIAGAAESSAPAAAAPASAAAASRTTEAIAALGRYVIGMKLEDAPGGAVSVPQGAILITNDGAGLAGVLAERIRELGGTPVILVDKRSGEGDDAHVVIDAADPDETRQTVTTLRERHGRIGGIIHLRALREAPAFDSLDVAALHRLLDEEVKGFFNLLHAAALDLAEATGAWVLAAIDMGGEAGPHGLPVSERPWRAGILGLIKTAAVEWPAAIAKAVDVSGVATPGAADRLLAELAGPREAQEIYFRGDTRWVPDPREATLALETDAITLSREDVILIIGGARGITAEAARELAERHACTLVLAGRSPWPEPETDATSSAGDDRALKRKLFDAAKTRGEKPKPLDIELAARRILMNREMQATRAALEAAGSTVDYIQADAQDPVALAALLAAVRERHGRLDGIVYGAGLIDDKLIMDKPPASFARVFDLKVRAAFLLARLVEPGALKFFVLFSSIAGWVGNRGQSDYVAANAVLNRLAITLGHRWDRRVVAIDWGPWERAGMVTDLIRKQFEARGVILVPADAGRRFLADEIRYGQRDDSLVLALGKASGA